MSRPTAAAVYAAPRIALAAEDESSTAASNRGDWHVQRPGSTSGAGPDYLCAAERQVPCAALRSGRDDTAHTAFLKVREACLACHSAQGMAFINDSAVFEATAAFH
jgi:hypothetical protein